MQIQNVAIFAKVHDPRCLGVASDLIGWLERNGCTPMTDEQLTRQLGIPDALTIGEIRDQAELVVVLGGGRHADLGGTALQRQGSAYSGGQPG